MRILFTFLIKFFQLWVVSFYFNISTTSTCEICMQLAVNILLLMDILLGSSKFDLKLFWRRSTIPIHEDDPNFTSAVLLCISKLFSFRKEFIRSANQTLKWRTLSKVNSLYRGSRIGEKLTTMSLYFSTFMFLHSLLR